MIFFKKTESEKRLKELKRFKRDIKSFESYKKVGGREELHFEKGIHVNKKGDFIAFVNPTSLLTKEEMKRDYKRYKKAIDKRLSVYERDLEQKIHEEKVNAQWEEKQKKIREKLHDEREDKLAYNNSQECLDYLNAEFDKILAEKN